MTLNIQAFLKQHHHQTIIVGFSGGIDSVVLLHLLAQARETHGLTLQAVHVHHGLSVYADEWAAFCAKMCAAWQIPLHVKRVTVQPEHIGVEAAARTARYAAFQDVKGDCVALAHHRDDQVETFLLAALRGAGVRGLAAMSAQSDSGSLNVVRPLLHISRTQIEQYAAQHHLPFMEDDSNTNPDFLRNWIRHHWLPELYQRLPHADRHILAAIETLQDELELINEYNQFDEQFIYQNQQFNIANWRTLSPARRRQQLILFTKRYDLGTPRRASVMDFDRILQTNEQGAQWALPRGQAVAYRGILFALSNDWQTKWAWQTPLSGSLKQLAASSGLTFETRNVGLPETALHQNMTLRAAQTGDVLPMKVGSKSIKKLLQQSGVPPFLRAHYPVLVGEDGEIWAVVGLAVNQRVAVAGGVLPVSEHLARFLIE